MLMGQMMISALIAILAAMASVLSGNGILLTLVIYSTAGSLSLLTLAMLIYGGVLRSCETDRR